MSKNAEILLAMKAMGERYPEMRFGQMVANIATWAMGPGDEAVWDVSDEQFLRSIQEHLSNPGANGSQPQAR